PYALTSQEKIIRGRLPTLDIINQMFSRLFRNSLTSMLRASADVSTISTDTVKFGEFLKALPLPSSLHVFRMEPLRGHGMMVVENKLVFSLVDTFFGGSGSSKVKVVGRDFSTIEMRMTKNVVIQALEDLEKAWKPVHSVDINFVRSEVNPQFAAIVPPSDVVMVILFEVEMEDFSGTITVCIPYATVEPIMSKLREQFQSEQVEVDQAWMRRLRDQLMRAEVDMAVELGSTAIDTNRLLNMKVGDTLMLGNDVSDPLAVRVEGVRKYKGFPGSSRGSKAIQITDVIERDR
ncbi:MAG: flagellar motor switch protein FliM, partial [Nitrospinota bacterium]|nr:flagellar motor switch protein FliM [Nitrospinota bacterium]